MNTELITKIQELEEACNELEVAASQTGTECYVCVFLCTQTFHGIRGNFLPPPRVEFSVIVAELAVILHVSGFFTSSYLVAQQASLEEPISTVSSWCKDVL